MKRQVTIRLMLILMLVGALGWILAVPAQAASKQVLTSTQVKKGPANLDDAAWSEAKAIEVPFEGKEKFAGKKAAASVKSVYAGDRIYFLFHWADATQSVTKGAWKFEGGKWVHQKGNEDRIAVLFEINRINKFASKGCTVTCHGPADAPKKEWKFATASGAEKGDLWHWKAARSDPYHYAEDGWLTVAGKKTGRKNDEGKGGDQKNMTADKSKPKYMQDPAKKASSPGFLLFEEVIEISDSNTFNEGDVITYRMPKMPAGSRGDIKAMSRYADGAWTVMLARKLDTGNADDVAFNPRKKYSFALALFDDSGDENSYDSEVLTLKFGR